MHAQQEFHLPLFREHKLPVDDAEALARHLRLLSMQELLTGQSLIAKNIRKGFQADDLQKHIAAMSRPGEWGTYAEAALLGAACNVNVVVTEKGKKYVLYASSDRAAYTVDLKNSGNLHWSAHDYTPGGGDCLFHAFTQRLQDIAHHEHLPDFDREQRELSFFVEQHGALTDDDVREADEREKHLSKEEQQQLQEDAALARRLLLVQDKKPTSLQPKVKTSSVKSQPLSQSLTPSRARMMEKKSVQVKKEPVEPTINAIIQAQKERLEYFNRLKNHGFLAPQESKSVSLTDADQAALDLATDEYKKTKP